MSNRGNQDYFKISGSPTEQRDIARMAHQSLAREQAKQRRAIKGPPPGIAQSVGVQLHPKPKFKKPDARQKPSTAAGQGTLGPIGEVKMDTGGFHVPSFGEAARMALSGAWKLGGWAAGLTLHYGGRAILRRVESLLGSDKREPDEVDGVRADQMPTPI